MFCEASLIRCKQLSFAQSPIENADSMFMECECQDCGDLPVVVNFSNIKNGRFMFENSNVLPAQFIPIPADGFKNLTCGTSMFCNCGA